MMDPQLIYLRKGRKSWDMKKPKTRGEWASKVDQCKPWKVCKTNIVLVDYFYPFKEILNHLGLPDIFSGHSVPGTIFRFPLRAEPSDLSENIYTIRYIEIKLELVFTIPKLRLGRFS